jgi:hypothetical protein
MVVARIFRRRLQQSRSAFASRLTTAQRTVTAEILDELPPCDPRAIRSRRDLQRVNRAMGNCGILTRVCRRVLPPAASGARLRILELGAGDGTLSLRLAAHLARSWRTVEMTLLDRQALIGESTGTAFAHLGWTLCPLGVDVMQWARAPAHPGAQKCWDLILVNLFLHHLQLDALRELLASVAQRCDAFIACEPRRSLAALLGTGLLPALAVSRDTLHDATISVRAGFRGEELSRLWPAQAPGWRLCETPAGLFSHLFVARRAGAP